MIAHPQKRQKGGENMDWKSIMIRLALTVGAELFRAYTVQQTAQTVAQKTVDTHVESTQH